MGFDKLRENGELAILRPASAWLLPIVFSVISLGIAAAGDAGRALLRYDRTAIADGEVWRLASGHFAHLGTSHLLLNLAGLCLVWALVGRRMRPGHWLMISVVTIACISLGFWFLDAQLEWYVGLSGVLHGLLLGGAVAGLRKARGESLAILVVVIVKLAWEQLLGPLPGSEASSGGNVVVNAHLYGAIAGAICAIFLWRSVGRAASI